MSDEPTTHRAWPRGPVVPPHHAAVLTVVVGTRRGHTFTLDREEHVIGRSGRSDLRLQDCRVSREHAKVVRTKQGVFNLFDLQSTNGTAVNGHRIDVAVLRPHDRVQIGPEVELWFGHAAPEIGAERREQVAQRLRKQLSARQLQVAKLVAEGVSNREVAERLNLGVRTVESHLKNVYQQLEINSRSALTRLIVEAGLITAQ